MKNDYNPGSFAHIAACHKAVEDRKNFFSLKSILLSLLVPLLFVVESHAQYCGPNVPTFNVNLTGQPNGSWISPNTSRNDQCCGATNPDLCVQFVVTLDPQSLGIIFDIYSGAVPPGALYYQINCGPPTPVGAPICLSGVGPHTITFCKPGNNSNQYIITSLGAPSISAPLTLNNGCSGIIWAHFYTESTMTWTSVYPGPTGNYNSYLSCTAGCDTVTVTGQPGFPPYVDYQVCGMVPCSGMHCDTIRVFFNPTLAATITPVNPTLCFGSPGVQVTANPSGGSTPYNYLWSTGATTQSIFVGVGTYTVTVGDGSGCPPTTATVTVTAFAQPITANAGPDQSVCAVSPNVQLNGTVTGVTTGIWLGGMGTFTPNNTTLNAMYAPSASEITNGGVTLKLKTTNNQTCPADSDLMNITINSFSGVATMTINDVTCNGYNNGTGNVSMAFGNPPYTFIWNTTPIQTAATATGLSPGNYSVLITDVHGCTGTQTISIAQPAPLTLNPAGFNSTCYNACNGQCVVIPNGGNGNNAFLWSPGNGNTASINNLCIGTYTVVVTDQKGCTATATATVNQPPIISLVTNSVAAHCNHADGSASVNASGGTPGYNYNWTPGNQTGTTASALIPGTYTVTVTDLNGCTSTQQVTVGNLPGVAASIPSVTNATCFNQCNGTASSLATGGNGSYTYSWNTSPSQSTINATALCAGNYLVYITDANGCTSTATATITQPAQVVISSISPPLTICIGQSTTLTASATGGSGTYTYSWAPSGPTVSPTTTTTYTVFVTDQNGCTGQSQTVTVTVRPPLSIIAQGSAASCSGSMVTLTANTSGGNNGPYTYTWMPGNLTGSAINVSPLVTTTYTVTTSDNCSPLVNTTATATVNALPVVSFTANASSGCAGMCVQFNSTSMSAVAWSWNFGDGGNSNIANPLHCYTNAGNYSVSLTITDANGCSATLLNNNMLAVHPNPVADFVMGPQPTTILDPRICFTDLSTHDVTTWYWNFGDQNDLLTSTAQNPCHSYTDTGTYCASLIVHNQYGCWNTVTYCLIIQPYFAIYVPNAFTPNEDGTNDTFFPKGVSIDPNNYHLWIFDRWGKNIFETEKLDKGWDGHANGGDEIAQIGVYVWKINVKDHEGKMHELMGSVSIIK